VMKGERDLAHAAASTENAPVTISQEFLGNPRECVDLVVIPVDLQGRPILDTLPRIALADGEGNVTLSYERNHVALVGQQLGTANVAVTFGAVTVWVPVTVVPSSR